MNESDKQAEPVAWVPENWTVFNSGAEVKRDLSFQEAWDYMTPERLARGWCAVCVVDGGNMPTQAQPVQPSTSAEDYLRGKYGAYRGHFAWRELEEAFNAGRQAQPVQPAGAQGEPVRLNDDDLTKIYMRFVGHQGLYPRLFEDIAGCVMTAMFEKSPPPAAAINEQLLKALVDTDRIIGGQLELIEQRANGDFLNKRPVVQSLTAHRTRIQKAIAQAEAEKAKGGV